MKSSDFQKRVSNIRKALLILERGMSVSDNETSEALAIVFAKIYMLGFAINVPEGQNKWVERVNYVLSKVHHSLFDIGTKIPLIYSINC